MTRPIASFFPAGLAQPVIAAPTTDRLPWLDVGLITVVALLLLLVAGVALRRRTRAANRQGPAELIQEVDLGRRQRLLLVRVSGEYLLLGGTPRRLTLLQRLERPPVQPDPGKPREPTL